MKNIKSFEDFVNENETLLVEMKTLSPVNVKTYELNKASIAALKKWSYKAKDLEIKFLDVEEYWNKAYTPSFIEFLNGKVTYSGWTKFSINGEEFGIQIEYNGKSQPGLTDRGSYSPKDSTFGIKQSEYLMFIGEEEDKVGGFVKLLDFLFKKYENEVIEFFADKLNLPILYVIPVGDIAPATGKTPHGWSIYDNPSGVLGILKTGGAVINATGMKIGDKFKLMDDQKRKELRREVEIVDLVPCNYDSYVKYCRSKGLDVPVRAFQKQTGRGKIYLYSIK